MLSICGLRGDDIYEALCYIKYKNMKHNPIARKNLTEFDGK